MLGYAYCHINVIKCVHECVAKETRRTEKKAFELLRIYI
jgi:hypothetical protein